MERKSWKLWILAVLAAVMVCVMAGPAAVAEDNGGTQIILTEEAEKVQSASMDVDTERSAELFVDRAMRGTRLRGVTLKGASLTGGSRNLYDRLRTDIIAVANGAEGCDGSTIFYYSVEEIYPQTSFTAEDLGVASVKELSETYINENGVTVHVYSMATDAYAAIQAKREEMLDFKEVLDCLQQDCSYELYWYDKTDNGTSMMGAGNAAGSGAYGLNDDMTRAEIKGQVTVMLVVSQDYAVRTPIDEHSYSINPYKVDIASYGGAAATAAANAQSIVSAHENESNYQRLLSYKNAICTETDYNHEAADDDHTPYGNPWQLVWVFDGNPGTKVVCEGYSKAFKYLNDLSSNHEVDVILAQGTMTGATGAGPHMWNIVRMEDGRNYLADITNCDAGSVGYPDLLFLTGPASGNVTDGYVFTTGDSSVSYVYDGYNYSEERITLDEYGYLYHQDHPVSEEISWDFTREDWDGSHGLLVISGTGTITKAISAQWGEYANEIDQIVIGSGINKIEADVFANLPNLIRVDFNEAFAPTISETAFSGTNAIFRYYTDNDSWPTGDNWIYLPVDNQDGSEQQVIYTADQGWGMRLDAGKTVYMSARQTKEASFRLRQANLDAMPPADEFEYICCDWEATASINFYDDCIGTITLNIPQNRYGTSVMCLAPGMNLTINSTYKMQMLTVSGGTVNCTSDIGYVGLSTNTGDQPADVTLNGHIDTLHLSSGNQYNAYKGSLTLNGSITEGHVYSTVEFTVPNVSKPVPFVYVVIANLTMDTEGETRTIVSNGAIVADGAAVNPYEQYKFRYELNDDQWCVGLDPKDDSTLSSPAAVSLAEYEPDFNENDIVYGDQTNLIIRNASRPVTLNGRLHEVFISNCTVIFNGPVWDLYESEIYHTTINNTVDYLYVLDQADSNVDMGENAYIGTGYWRRRLRGDAYFNSISGPRDLYSNGQLHVLSWKNGQTIGTILPSDEEVTAAAGLTGGVKATADVSDSSEQALNYAEKTALDSFLSEKGTDATAAVFDATVISYTEDAFGNVIPGEEITSLNRSIPITVSNRTGNECYIVRLHEENGVVTATQLTEPSDDEEIPFESNLFSKYALITTGTSFDPSQLNTLILPESLTQIEDYAFEGGAFQAVIIPDSCRTIGIGAFKDCRELVYVSFKQGTLGIDDALTGCGKIVFDVR